MRTRAAKPFTGKVIFEFLKIKETHGYIFYIIQDTAEVKHVSKKKYTK